MILLIDNYDSFVHNLARYFRLLGQATQVVRNDQISLDEIRDRQPDAIVLSPGPCAPKQAGISLELVRELHTDYPILGICLGHQTIAEALGAQVVRAEKPVHGRASQLFHRGTGLFSELPSPMRVARYHSLVIRDLPESLSVDGELSDGTPMAISHRDYPVYGWQFHPESILTTFGYELLSAFLKSIGHSVPARNLDLEKRGSTDSESDWFRRAIQFPKSG